MATTTQLLRAVLNKRYSEDQERDERGRFASGESSSVQGSGSQEDVSKAFTEGANVKTPEGEIKQVISVNLQGQVITGKIGKGGGIEGAETFHPAKLQVEIPKSKEAINPTGEVKDFKVKFQGREDWGGGTFIEVVKGKSAKEALDKAFDKTSGYKAGKGAVAIGVGVWNDQHKTYDQVGIDFTTPKAKKVKDNNPYNKKRSMNLRYSEDQERDENGRFTSSDGGEIKKGDEVIGSKPYGLTPHKDFPGTFTGHISEGGFVEVKLNDGDKQLFHPDDVKKAKPKPVGSDREGNKVSKGDKVTVKEPTMKRPKEGTIHDATISGDIFTVKFPDGTKEKVSPHHVTKKRSILSMEDRINELKTRTGFIEYRRINISAVGYKQDKKSDFDKRIIRGYLCKWGNRNDYGEKFVKGAFAKSINERGPNSNAKYKITFLWQHDLCDPLALFNILEEDEYGLYFETAPLDDVPNADRAIEQIRSGTLNQFSVGFHYVWDKIEYDDKDDSLVIAECDFVEGSVVTAGSDRETYAMRSTGNTEVELYDEIENFINILPRKDRLQARQLFTQQKALIQVEKREIKLKVDKPPMKRVKNRKINLNFVTKNL